MRSPVECVSAAKLMEKSGSGTRQDMQMLVDELGLWSDTFMVVREFLTPAGKVMLGDMLALGLVFTLALIVSEASENASDSH